MPRNASNINDIAKSILHEISLLPGGYSFLSSLSGYKKRVFTTSIKTLVSSVIYSPTFRTAALQACLFPSGAVTTEGRDLYRWLLRNVYLGKERVLYEDFIKLVKGKVNEHDSCSTRKEL
jgi:hypothetical protein